MKIFFVFVAAFVAGFIAAQHVEVTVAFKASASHEQMADFGDYGYDYTDDYSGYDTSE